MITGLKPGWRRICLLLLAVPLLLPGWPIGGQQQPTMSVDVRVVNVFATVRNKHGEIVPNLTKDDFTLEEDGRPQAIRYFTRETALHHLFVRRQVDCIIKQSAAAPLMRAGPGAGRIVGDTPGELRSLEQLKGGL